MIDGADNRAVVIKADAHGWRRRLLAHMANNRLGFDLAGLLVVGKHLALPLRLDEFSYWRLRTIGERDQLTVAEAFVHDVDLVASAAAKQVDVLAQVADVVHTGVGGG